jgi:hypothetical protein
MTDKTKSWLPNPVGFCWKNRGKLAFANMSDTVTFPRPDDQEYVYTESQVLELVKAIAEDRDQAQAKAAKLADELEEANKEIEGQGSSIIRMGEILSDTIEALRGPAPPLTSWSTHDTATWAYRVVQERNHLLNAHKLINPPSDPLSPDIVRKLKPLQEASAKATQGDWFYTSYADNNDELVYRITPRESDKETDGYEDTIAELWSGEQDGEFGIEPEVILTK